MADSLWHAHIKETNAAAKREQEFQYAYAVMTYAERAGRSSPTIYYQNNSKGNCMLGLKVRNKILGPKIIGTVVMAATALEYRQFVGHDRLVFPNWDRYYPRWQEGNLIVVKLDNPAKPVRPDECPANGIPSYEEIEEMNWFVYPEGDVFLA